MAFENPHTPKILPFKSGWLSQWHHSKFVDEELDAPYNLIMFTSCEQYMMFSKAFLMGDNETAKKIVNEHNCRSLKNMGRAVEGFDQEVWDNNKQDIVRRGNFLKFSQNGGLKKKLLATAPKILCEGSKWDKIWGVGLDANDSQIHNKKNWRGTNLLGECLGQVREMILMKEFERQSLVSEEYDSDSDSD
jgi:ribA/ribD-fused uncharacterized protein